MKKAKLLPRKRNREMTGLDFEALSESEKHTIIADIESKTPQQHLAESRPLSRREQAAWDKLSRNKVGRPKFGRNGVKVIALSVEKDLLAAADLFAKEHGLKRAELFTQALRSMLSAG